jgi:hypothetical protein
MQIDALADNGHSRIENAPSAETLELPVRVVAFSDGLYVMRAAENNADLLGGRVTAIDGQSIDAVMSKLEQLRGGTSSWRRLHASQYVTQQDLLFGIDVAPDLQHSNWTVETPAGVVWAQGAGPTDPLIASIVVTANQVDIDAGKLALSESHSKDVKEFAQRMVTDHTGVNQSATELVTKLHVTPEPNPTSQSLQKACSRS